VVLDYIKNNEVDLIVSDIKMPDMDGFYLLEQIKQINNSISVVFLSGYSDFEYARKAIRLGADDYLLKPVGWDEADAVLKRIKEKLERSKSVNIKDNEKMKERINTSKYIFAICIEFLNNSNINLDNIIASENVVIQLGYKKYILILGYNEEKEKEDLINNLQPLGILGISQIYENIDKTKRIIKQARLCILNRFLYREKTVFYYSPISNLKINEIFDEFINLYKTSTKGLEIFFETLSKRIENYGLTIEDVQIIYNKIVGYFSNFEDLRPMLSALSCENLVDEYEDQEQLWQYLKVILINEETRTDNQFMNESFKKLLEYVRENYNKQLQLKQLSEMFSINLTYCCELFRKHTGKTFHEYLTAFRMKKAKELLLLQKSSVTEVSEGVGFEDYFYFNKVFKKHFGKTPKAMRDGK
jgi:two-component system response regulator YesN